VSGSLVVDFEAPVPRNRDEPLVRDPLELKRLRAALAAVVVVVVGASVVVVVVVVVAVVVVGGLVVVDVVVLVVVVAAAAAVVVVDVAVGVVLRATTGRQRGNVFFLLFLFKLATIQKKRKN